MAENPTILWSIVLGIVALGTLMLVAMIAIGIAWLASRKPAPAPPKPLDRSIDVNALDSSQVPDDVAQLEYYGCPVRLAVLVLAPVGREGAIPEKELLPELLEQFVPHFLQVVAAHQPKLDFWPAQFSTLGFTNSFFNNVKLPGKHGKGSPWCGVAGRFTALNQQYLAGIVCCGVDATGLGQLVVEQEGQWRDVLRVKV